MLNWELKTLLRTPFLSITKVTLPGRRPKVEGTPYSFCSSLPLSEITGKGRRFDRLNSALFASPWALMAMIRASRVEKSSAASRKLHDWDVQPGPARLLK